MKRAASVAALVGGMMFASVAAAAQAPPAYGLPIDGDQAQQAVSAAEAEARQNSWALTFAVVDAYGNLVMLKRMPGTGVMTADVAIRKAKTSAALRMPSKAAADMAASPGGVALWNLSPDILPVEGAVPIVVDGKIIGAIGASGAQSNQDAQAAARGAAAVR